MMQSLALVRSSELCLVDVRAALTTTVRITNLCTRDWKILRQDPTEEVFQPIVHFSQRFSFSEFSTSAFEQASVIHRFNAL